MKLAIIHNLPLEYYPPVTNLLGILSADEDFEVQVFTVENTKNRAPWSKDGIRVIRTRSPRAGQNPITRAVQYAQFIWRTLFGLTRFRPEAILSFEPHSALPVFLYLRCFSRRTRLFIHHHEYYEPQQFEGRGMRLPRLAHRCETRFLFPSAEWISQTNPKRRELFLADHPLLDPGKVEVLPNYPPRHWNGVSNRAWSGGTSPLRLLYLGSLSRADTYIGALVDWISTTTHEVTLDVHAYNVPGETAQWLAEQESGRIRFFPGGIDYERLPELMPDYHVGLILYRGNTTNFVWNAPNKLFEYLAGGLDVWYPPVMSGLHPFADSETLPRVLEIDFEQLDGIPFEKLSQRGNLPEREDQFDAETALSGLLQTLRNESGSPSPGGPPS